MCAFSDIYCRRTHTNGDLRTPCSRRGRCGVRGRAPQAGRHLRPGHGYVSCSIALLLPPLTYPPARLLKRCTAQRRPACERGHVGCISWQLHFGPASLIACHHGWVFWSDSRSWTTVEPTRYSFSAATWAPRRCANKAATLWPGNGSSKPLAVPQTPTFPLSAGPPQCQRSENSYGARRAADCPGLSSTSSDVGATPRVGGPARAGHAEYCGDPVVAAQHDRQGNYRRGAWASANNIQPDGSKSPTLSTITWLG